MTESGSDDAGPAAPCPTTPPPVPGGQRFFMPPPPRSIAAAAPQSTESVGGLALRLDAPGQGPDAAPVAGIVIQAVDPPRRRSRSDTTLLIALLAAVAVLAVCLGAAVLLGEVPR